MTNNNQLKKIVLTGLMTALVFLSTSIIKIPAANGYIHFGDGFVFMCAIILGPYYGAFAAGVGSMLADILSQYAHWAIPTIIIKSLMAMIMGLIIRHKTVKQTSLATGITLALWIIFVSIIKHALYSQINLSVNNLAELMEDSPENIMELASGIQWKLTLSAVAFLVMFFILIFWLVRKQKDSVFGPRAILGMMSSGSCMVIGYYIAETILYGNPVSPVFSVPMNLIQFITGVIITTAIAPALLKAYSFFDSQVKFPQ